MENEFEEKPRWKTLVGTMKTFFHLSKEEWGYMDHKLLRVVGGIVSLVVAALIWFYFFRGFGFLF